MNVFWKVFLYTAGLMWLVFAVYHLAGYAFGWTKFSPESLPAGVVGGVCGGIAGWVVVRRMNREKARQAGA